METLSYASLKKAVEVLELPEEATWSEIRSRYRSLIQRWHPDRATEPKEVAAQRTAAIVEAYETLKVFRDNYKFSFRDKDLKKSRTRDEVLQDFWNRQFDADPLWPGREKPKPPTKRNY